MRIGVNAGSLERRILDKYREPNADAMVESALFHSQILKMKMIFMILKLVLKPQMFF